MYDDRQSSTNFGESGWLIWGGQRLSMLALGKTFHRTVCAVTSDFAPLDLLHWAR